LAVTGREALARARQRRYDLIALDLLLPDLLGVEVLRGVREDERNRDTPVLVITVVAERGLVDPYPIVDYLVKPVSAEQLRASLARAGLLPRRAAPVLVVDDDPAARRLAEELLAGLGYASTGHADGASALRAAGETPPLAVLLDLLMPGMDGFEFLERFRHTAGGRDVPVIIWTVKDLTAADRQFLRERAQGIVSKASGKPGDLVALLRSHVPPRPPPFGEGEHVATLRADGPKKEGGKPWPMRAPGPRFAASSTRRRDDRTDGAHRRTGGHRRAAGGDVLPLPLAALVTPRALAADLVPRSTGGAPVHPRRGRRGT